MMTIAFTKLQKRVLSAIVIAPVVLWMIISGGLPLIFLVVFCFCVSFYEWVQLSRRTDKKFLLIIAGALYVGLGFFACYHIREDYGLKIAVLFITMVWVSDIGAYFTGKMLKGPKMAPQISPNKTWAGLAGAAFFPGVVGILFLVVFNYYTDSATPFLLTETKPFCIFLIGALMGVVGQLGDLMISCLKRLAGAKDSGTLIPGHGGLLDRVDSLMLAAAFFALMLQLYPQAFNV
ncbi:MAG: phosphatidate cytidylyltransferase [Alphaproteobacteria bacterium]